MSGRKGDIDGDKCLIKSFITYWCGVKNVRSCTSGFLVCAFLSWTGNLYLFFFTFTL